MSRPGRSAATLLSAFLALFVALALVAAARAQGFPGGPPVLTPTARLNTAQLVPGQQHVVAVVVDIPDKFHAQSATPSNADFIATAITVEPVTGVTVHPAVFPLGKDYDFPALGGKLNIYDGRVVIYVPLTVANEVAVGSTITLRGKLTMQLCDDKVCFPPSEDPWEVTATVAARGAQIAGAADPALFAAFDWSKFGETSAPATRPVNPSASAGPPAWLNFPLALVAGLLFNVMPCVLPVLPLKALSFYEAGKHSRARSIYLGALFAVGMTALFAGLGVMISFAGFTWGQHFQSPWFVYGISAVLVVMSLSMWGLFTINLPTALYAVDPSKDTAGGSFVFGAFTAILATPCTAPLLPALMLWAASQPPTVAVALFTTVGIGMALPYLIMAAFPELARALPRTGPASEIIKQTLGFFVFGTAAFLIAQRLLEGNHWAYVVTGVAVIAGGFVIYRTARLYAARQKPVAFATAFAVLLIGSTALAATRLNEKTVAWQPYSDQTLADARASGRTVLIKFTANWCANCHVVEGTVFTDKSVQKALLDRDVLLLKVDLTFNGAPGSELLRKLNPAGGIPLTAIYTKGEPEPTQLSSIYTAGTLIEILARQK